MLECHRCHRFVYEYARYGCAVYYGGIGYDDEHGSGCTSVDDNIEQCPCDRTDRSSMWDRTCCCW
jgi:hypothetical protein